MRSIPSTAFWKCIVIKFVPRNQSDNNVASDNGLAPNRRQSITWSNVYFDTMARHQATVC